MTATQRQGNSPTKPRKCSYGPAQAEFIKQTRDEIDQSGVRFFQDRDWTRIHPGGGRNTCLVGDNAFITADNFYIKPIAVWVPHLMIPNHVPTCPHCETNEYVDATNAKWVSKPKILYGVRSHRYLDTKSYRCHAANCGSFFYGYNEKSLRLDADKIFGLFNFRVSSGYAVDDELVSYIVNHSSDTTAGIYKRLALMVTDNWIEDAHYYYKAVRANKVKNKKGKKQVTLDGYLNGRQSTIAHDNLTRAKRELATAERDLDALIMKKEQDVDFVDVFRKKENRNHIGCPFKGLGKQKLLLLISKGITTAKELRDYSGNDKAILPQWKRIVKEYYESIANEIEVVRAEVDRRKDMVDFARLGVAMEEGDDADEPPTNNNSVRQHQQQSPTGTSPKFPPFSRLMDTAKYNARCVSKSTIDRIVVTDFQHRKQIQEDKMRGVKAEILKIDWHYKLPPKIKVFTGPGESFTPFKSACSIQQEDAQTIFWKCYPCSESMEAMEPDLQRLKERFKILGCTPKVCYVDNCCQVRAKLRAVFGDEFLVKLDVYHWMKRWDKVIFDTSSAEASVFRELLHKALYVVERNEYNRVKYMLIGKRRRNPQASEILKEAKATIPDKETLERRVNAVLQYIYYHDLTTEANITMANGTSSSNRRFLKPLDDEIRNLIANQLNHVTHGCLSDPPKTVVKIHRVNPTTKKAFSARSTGTNENDNMQLNRLLNTPSVGLPRAERLISDHYEQSNDRKRVSRLGELQHCTHRTEKLYVLQSVAYSLGYRDNDLPLDEHLSAPTSLDQLKEYMGMEYDLPVHFKETRDITDVETEDHLDDLQESVAESDFANFLNNIDFGDENNDIPVDPNSVQRTLDTLAVEPTPVLPIEVIDNEIQPILTPDIKPRETTFEAFLRLTQHRPWVPFRRVDSASPTTKIDKEEYDLFDRFILDKKYDRHAGYLNSARGYGRFSKEWDMEVARRYAARATGNNSVILIHRKSTEFLQKHFDLLEKHRGKSKHSNNNEPKRKALLDTLTKTRRDMLPLQEVYTCMPVQYNPQLGRPSFGTPTALNAQIAAQAMMHNPQVQQRTIAPFILRPTTTENCDRTTSARMLGKHFNNNKYCWRCGFQRREHNRVGVRFGDNCTNNCNHFECAKCGQVERFHVRGNRMGPTCTLPPGPNSDYRSWYKKSTTTGRTTGII